MKLIITCLMLSNLLCIAHAQQSVFPVLIDSPKWCMVTTAYNGDNPRFFYYPFDYTYQKDTVVDGKSYSKLISNAISSDAHGALIRNEGKKTYIRRIIPNQDPTAYSKETMLYNFDMKTTKDSIFVTTVYGPGIFERIDSIIVKFRSADSVSFNGIRRKRLNVEYRTNDRYYTPLRPLYGEWIEGFGSYRNPFYDIIKYQDAWSQVMGMDLNGLRAYENREIANGCSPKRVNVFDPFLSNITVYPNPIVQYLNIDLSKSTHLSSIDIVLYDLVGHTVFKQHFKTFQSPLSIDMSYLNGGMYILSIQHQNEKLFSKKIVKSN
jgi:Secretion system C-terminal sorting domain